MRQNGKTVSPASNEGRNSYVVEHITEALLKQMRDKPVEEISIRELCETAGVGRASFYRNFSSKEDILRRYIQNLFQDWTGGDEQEGGQPLSRRLRAMFSHFEAHRDFYALLYRRHRMDLLQDVLIGIYGPKPEHTKPEAYARAYVAYALYGWIAVWFQRGMQETAEEIAEMFQSQGL